MQAIDSPEQPVRLVVDPIKEVKGIRTAIAATDPEADGPEAARAVGRDPRAWLQFFPANLHRAPAAASNDSRLQIYPIYYESSPRGVLTTRTLAVIALPMMAIIWVSK
jgi:hypothetical protein